MSEKLISYRKKRDFTRTAEPSGTRTRGRKGESHKFVVQYHDASRLHYDFRLEWRGVLLSWAVPKGPSYSPKDKRLAVRVEDHPVEYADFEGVIPKGQYGGGTVMLWDEGEWEAQTDFARGLETGSLKIVLHGSRLKGKWALVRLKPRDGDNNENWLLIKENDAFAKRTNGISRYKSGVRSGRTFDEIAADGDPTRRKNPFREAEAQLAKSADAVPREDGWLYEIKYDGYRIKAFTEGGEARLTTRNGHDYTEKFPSVADALAKWSAGRAMVLDGEMVVNDARGRSDFQALQNYLKKRDGGALVYMIFDLLALDGEDLRELPLSERKARLEALLRSAPPNLRYSRHVEGHGEEVFASAAKLGLEGIIGKRADSRYGGTRSGDWIKVKCYRRQEFVIGGYTLSDKKTEGVSALLLGVYEGGKLVYAGRAGTGMTRSEASELAATFDKLSAAKPPFAEAPAVGRGERIFWLKPRLIAEVQFAEWTSEGVLRQASFKGLRADKDPKEVVRERAEAPQRDKKVAAAAASAVKHAVVKPAVRRATPKTAPKSAAGQRARRNDALTQRKDGEVVCGVAISNPDKIVFRSPEVKKIEVVRYYETVSARMLRYAAGRVLSVVRCHKGVSSACFYKKHPVNAGEGVAVIPIENSEGKTDDYFYIENVKGLISEAQLGSLEFHIWGSRAKNLDLPDLMVFDLDPDEGMELARVRQGVRDLKSVLDKLSLKSFLKTSGGKGYHVVVPFKPTVGWEAFHDFARGIAELMERKWPDRYTCNVRKIKRAGKIYIDWARNGRGSTSVAPYSLRARPGARVSMPISWKELDTVAPDGIDIFEASRRIAKSDPWKNFFKVEQELEI